MKRGREVTGKKLARLTAKKQRRGERRWDERVRFCADDMARVSMQREAERVQAAEEASQP